jgi:hypothetical protein
MPPYAYSIIFDIFFQQSIVLSVAFYYVCAKEFFKMLII